MNNKNSAGPDPRAPVNDHDEDLICYGRALQLLRSPRDKFPWWFVLIGALLLLAIWCALAVFMR